MHEFRQDLRQQRLRDGDRHADAHGAARRRSRRLLHDVHGRLRFGEHRLAMLVEQLARFGQRELARGALQQTHAERRLQFGQTPRQTRLRDAEHPLRRGKSAVLDDLREVHQVIQIVRIDLHLIVPLNRTIHCVTVAGTSKNGPYNSSMFQNLALFPIFAR